MTNDRQQQLQDLRRQAWLTEYQVCQHYNSQQSTSYWTLTSIFIGFSSVLLGALIYAFSSNKYSCLLGIITCVISIAVLLILYFLKGWGKRVAFLQQINFMRMREIESELGMRASWRVHGTDNWIGEGKFKGKITDSDKKADIDMLLDYKSPEWWEKMRYDCDQRFPKYEFSSSWHYTGILYTLFSLWTLVWLGGISSLFYYDYNTAAFILTVISIIVFIVILFKRAKKLDE